MVGIVTGFRRVITKANATMGVATIEDLQGSSEVVVFPKMYEQTAATWTEGSILAVAGRVDHRGEDVSLLADLATEWDAAVAKGPEAFAREVAAGDRGRGPRRQPVAVGPGTAAPVNGNGSGAGNGNGRAGMATPRRRPRRRLRERSPTSRRSAPSSAGKRHRRAPRIPPRSPRSPVRRPRRPRTAPLSSPPPSRSRPTRSRPASSASRPTTTSSPRCPTRPATGPPSPPAPRRRRSTRHPRAILHVTFATGAGSDRVVGAMEAFKGLLVERPGSTRVVLHVPAPSGGASLPMELRRGVAYDAELLAEVRRRLGEGIVELSLS